MLRQQTSSEVPEGLCIGPWRVDRAADELRAETNVVRLRPKVMELLLTLARHPGEVLTKHQLLDAVWPDVVVTEASLSVAVGELRAALGDNPAEPRFIETIPRRGYRLIAPVVADGSRQPTRTVAQLVGGGRTIPLAEGRTVIGRDPACDVQLRSQHVSRRHACIRVLDGRIEVEDLGSKNGTFVGDRRIDSPTEVRAGDLLRFGRHSATMQLIVDTSSTWTEMSSVHPGDDTPD